MSIFFVFFFFPLLEFSLLCGPKSHRGTWGIRGTEIVVGSGDDPGDLELRVGGTFAQDAVGSAFLSCGPLGYQG